MSHVLSTENRAHHQIELSIPGSKSITYRALILAALADGVSEISGIHIDDDIRAFINALYQLGIVAQLDEQSASCIVAGCNGHFPRKQATLWCGNKEIATKFLLASCASTPGVFYLDGSPRLRKKSLQALLEILLRQGAQIIPNDSQSLPLTLLGADSLEGGDIAILKRDQSKIISALLIAAPYARSPFVINKPNAVSNSYVDMTCGMMAEFGVLVHRVHRGQLMVPVPQRYHSRDYNIEPDLGLSAYFFVAAILANVSVLIPKIKRHHSKQQEVKFFEILESMGCTILDTHNGLILQPSPQLSGIEISMSKFSDMFLALCVLAPFASAPVQIRHVGKLSAQESERFQNIAILLKKLGTELELGKNWIKIHPSQLQPAILEIIHDPRLLMACSLLRIKMPHLVIPGTDILEKHSSCFSQNLDKFLLYTANVAHQT